MNLVPLRSNDASCAGLVDELMPMAAAFYDHFSYAYGETRHRAMIEAFLSDERTGALWLISHDGNHVGYVALSYVFSFEFGGRVGLIDELFVLPALRSTGLGGAVVRELQAQMNSLGLHALHLQTENENPRAKLLYESLGFVTLPRAILAYKR